jgi:hypothetical protein
VILAYAQLVSYIAPSAPATRRPAEGAEPAVRPEVGFTPRWFRQHLEVDFGRLWHTDAAYRRETVRSMRSLLKQRFPGTGIGGVERPMDLLTGTYGACVVAAIYGTPIRYFEDNWPDCEHQYLTDDEIDRLEPPNLDHNPFFQELMAQVDWIAESEGRVEGYINWQGVLNNAHRLRGEQLFLDMKTRADQARRLFECVCETMIEAARRLHERQRQTGVDVSFFTASNCLVNMISPEQYGDLLLPFDRRIAESFVLIGIHNCAWKADPYVDHYATVPNLGYIDMGLDSDLRRAREIFPKARRAIMYKPTDLARKPLGEIREDFRRIAREYAPCDIVLADIDAGTPDERVCAALESCRTLTEEMKV